jgi:DNA-binding NarL/FixJ family response regulator
VSLDQGEVVVFSYAVDATELPDCLSVAEREVATAVLRGESNARIAKRRGTSVRTTANQVASVFRKLGVRSRSELAAAWLPGHGRADTCRHGCRRGAGSTRTRP